MLICVDDITVSLGERRAFEHTSWTIEKNQDWAILGETGSGKTSLARALCRKLPLAGGQIRYYFEDQPRPYLLPGEILTLSAETHQDFLRPYAAYVQARWQSFEGEDAPTVAGLLAGKDGGKGDLERQAELIRLLDLEPLLGRKILHLSHGESRKVFIARLMMDAPRLLILDDPYTGLDAASRAHLSAAIAALIGRGAPQIVFISSRAAEIPAGIGSLLRVEDCRVVEQGPRAASEQRQAGKAAYVRPTAPAGFQKTAVFESMTWQYAVALARNPALRVGEIIRMSGVSVRYGEVQVLNQVDWTVRQGERWALLGPNGAGKTTLLSLILGDNPQAYANQIDLFGRRRGTGESIWEIKQNVGWVSPELQIYYPREASFLDVVVSGFFDSAGLYRTPSPEQSALAEGWIRAFGMEPAADLPFNGLSAGQQRLALLARALVKHPPLLVLDEPCQGLDEPHRRYFVELLDQLCAHAPLTLIYVTHYLEEIPRCVSHRLRLNQGTVDIDHGVK
jgi:molybdate transport system ATP-binding protein